MKRKTDKDRERRSSKDKRKRSKDKRRSRSRDRSKQSRERKRTKESKDRNRDRRSKERRRSRDKDKRKRSKDSPYHKRSSDKSKHREDFRRSRSVEKIDKRTLTFPSQFDEIFSESLFQRDLSVTLLNQKQKVVDSGDYSESSGSKKPRRSRWSANEFDKCAIIGMPTTLPPNMKPEDAEVYVIQLEIAEITNKLKKQNYTSEIEAMSRLPSPDPLYGPDGKRINTKEYRARERLEDRRRLMIEKLQAIRPDLVPQTDKMGTRYEEKVFIPQDDYPDINFAGLIIGPRGMTQKELEKETGTRIILRGKGSVKCGKISMNSIPLPGEDEPLHAYVTSFSRENIVVAVEKIKKIIQDGIDFPELENDLRKNQMKQLAILNGTYRETEGLNRLKMLSEAQSIVTNTIICSLCGGTGHLPRDCKANDPMSIVPPSINQIDGEYNSFINELGPDAQVGSYYFFPPGTNLDSSNMSSQNVNSFVRKFVFNS